MNIECYLVINRSGSLRIVKSRPSLNSSEIAVKLNLTIPRSFFERLIPVADLVIPEEYAPKEQIEFVTRLNAEKVAEAMNLEADAVEDGLKEMLDTKEELNNEEKQNPTNN